MDAKGIEVRARDRVYCFFRSVFLFWVSFTFISSHFLLKLIYVLARAHLPLQTVRRDNCGLVAQVVSECLNKILMEKSVGGQYSSVHPPVCMCLSVCLSDLLSDWLAS